MGGGVAVQGDHPRCPMLPDSSGKEPLGCGDVPALAQEKVDRSTSFIHCAIEVHPLAFDLDIGLVHTPGVAHRSRMPVPALFKVWHVPLHPSKNSRMGQSDATLGHNLDEVSGAEFKRQVPAHA